MHQYRPTKSMYSITRKLLTNSVSLFLIFGLLLVFLFFLSSWYRNVSISDLFELKSLRLVYYFVVLLLIFQS